MGFYDLIDEHLDYINLSVLTQKEAIAYIDKHYKK